MVTVDPDDAARRLTDLADQLADAGKLRTPEWRAAFLAVRRDVFVPRFWHDEEPGAFPARWRMIDNATTDHDVWLDAIYSDRTLATELTGVPTVGGSRHPQVTSSTTMPGLVMAMLEDLDVADGMKVLEIGTGTGYNAALLCQRLGDDHVTSIDISPELIALAGVRLAAHGFSPHLIAGDGAEGAPRRAPFDRIIATCGLHQVPRAWLDQTRDGGKILLNLLGPFNPFALVLLTVTGDTASGRILPQSGNFMPRRTRPDQAADYTVAIHRPTDGTSDSYAEGCTALDPRAAYTDRHWALFVQAHLPNLVSRQVYIDANEHLGTELATADNTSWALVHHDPDGAGHRVEQSGPRHLWNELEELHALWTATDRPTADRIRFTLHPNGETTAWVDDRDPRRESPLPVS